jgi:D-glycero-D-manno-heptose 1,7-bisphosphate phosphatase
MQRAIFLDRDGVINRALTRAGKPYPPASLDDFDVLPGVPEAVNRFKDAGFAVVVVTNQPDVATGVQRREVVEEMHNYLHRLMPIDDIKVCYHVDADDCSCRKPRPGMLVSSANERSLWLAESFMIGDRWRDIEAGKNAGCRTVLIRCPYQERPATNPDWVVDSLFEASELICSLSPNRQEPS